MATQVRSSARYHHHVAHLRPDFLIATGTPIGLHCPRGWHRPHVVVVVADQHGHNNRFNAELFLLLFLLRIRRRHLLSFSCFKVSMVLPHVVGIAARIVIPQLLPVNPSSGTTCAA
jgi:hypothetical protein